jgi:hypothetical protein
MGDHDTWGGGEQDPDHENSLRPSGVERKSSRKGDRLA